MWRSTLLALAFLLLCPLAFSQSTTVSGQVTDSGVPAQSWNNGTYTFTFVPSGNNPVGPYTWTGGTLNTTITGSLTATGSYSVSIPSNTAISPVNSVWSAKFCPQASSSCFYVNNITVAGATQTVNATPPAILISLQTAVPPVLAYSTSEITGAVIGSQFFLLGTGIQVCTAVSGNSCTTWTASGGSTAAAIAGNTNSTYISPACPQPSSGNCFFANFDVQYALGDVTCNNGSQTVTIASAPITSFSITSNVVTFQAVNTFSLSNSVFISGLSIGTYLNNQNLTIASVSGTQFTANFTHANVGSTTDAGFATTDPPFTLLLNGQSTAVGLPIAGGDNILNHAANCPPQGTITAVNSPVSVQVSNASTTSVTNGSLGWGHNDGAAIQTAFNASLGKGCLYLPQGNAFFDIPPFLDLRAQPKGAATCIIGTGQTLMTPLPAFNYSSCVANSACFFTWPNGANQNPNYALLQDFTFFGLGYNLTGTGTNNTFLQLTRVTEENVWLWHLGNSAGAGRTYIGPDSSFSAITDTSGVTNCVVNGSGLNATVQWTTAFCGEGGASVSVLPGAFLESTTSQYGPGPAAGPSETISGHWLSVGEVHFAPGSGQDTIRVNSGGSLILDDAQVTGAVGNTLGAIDCNASGATVELRGNMQVAGGASGGVPFRSVAGCSIIDHSSKITITGGANSLGGSWVGNSSTNSIPVTAAKTVLSAGWGTTAAVTALSGGDAPVQFTITNSGTGQGASPTITYTFPTPYIVAPFSCTATQVGGTNATGTFTSSALSVTGVTFTFSLTPTASSTEIVQVVCVTP